MHYKIGTIAGGIYVIFALFSVIILLPFGMLAHLDTENSVENINLSLNDVILNWKNVTHVESLTLRLDVNNPSSNFDLILEDMRILDAKLDDTEISVITTANTFVDLNEVVPSKTSETISYTFPTVYGFIYDNLYFHQEKLDGSSNWDWLIYLQIRASLGTRTDIQIEGYIHHTGVTNTGNS